MLIMTNGPLGCCFDRLGIIQNRREEPVEAVWGLIVVAVLTSRVGASVGIKFNCCAVPEMNFRFFSFFHRM